METQNLDLSGIYRAKVVSNADTKNRGRLLLYIPVIMGAEYNDDNDNEKLVSVRNKDTIFDDKSPYKSNETINITNGIWAEASNILNNEGGNGGSYIVPNKGAWIYMFFEGQDIQKPVWTNMYCNMTKSIDSTKWVNTSESTGEKRTKNRILYQTDKGDIIYMDENNDTITINKYNGLKMTMSKDKFVLDKGTESIIVDAASNKITNKAQVEINNAVQNSTIIQTQDNIDIKTGSADVKLDKSGNISIKNSGANIELTSSSITLKCGASSIVLNAGGLVSIKGTGYQFG